ncbi:NAD(P)H-binding protein [Tsukamurella soli]|uniref:NAD(P)H-binding protein n=1 Tax=Tsukamurella soli TaxID=644556 RepID=A0ABP8JEK0_9ACTN
MLSRRPGPDGAGRVTHVTGDLLAVLEPATLAGVDVVVHCATTNGRRDAESTRNLVEAAHRAGVGHLVYISIVGIDDVPFGYYRAKLAAERVITDSPVGWTILRATQFHDLIERILAAQAALPAVLVPRGATDQPIDVGTVADRLVELAAGPPAGRVTDIGGPEVRRFADLAETYLRVRGSRRRVVGVPIPGELGRALRAGRLTTPDNRVGTITFEEHLTHRG